MRPGRHGAALRVDRRRATIRGRRARRRPCPTAATFPSTTRRLAPSRVPCGPDVHTVAFFTSTAFGEASGPRPPGRQRAHVGVRRVLLRPLPLRRRVRPRSRARADPRRGRVRPRGRVRLASRRRAAGGRPRRAAASHRRRGFDLLRAGQAERRRRRSRTQSRCAVAARRSSPTDGTRRPAAGVTPTPRQARARVRCAASTRRALQPGTCPSPRPFFGFTSYGRPSTNVVEDARPLREERPGRHDEVRERARRDLARAAGEAELARRHRREGREEVVRREAAGARLPHAVRRGPASSGETVRREREREAEVAHPPRVRGRAVPRAQALQGDVAPLVLVLDGRRRREREREDEIAVSRPSPRPQEGRRRARADVARLQPNSAAIFAARRSARTSGASKTTVSLPDGGVARGDPRRRSALRGAPARRLRA